MSQRKVAVVTGSNRGIGFSLVEKLCQDFDGDVILCSRNAEKGEEALQALKKMGLNPTMKLLSTTDPMSIFNLRDYLKVTYGGLDLLVNNAAIFIAEDPFSVETTEKVMETNFFAVSRLCKILFPLLRQGSRVVNVSSNAGCLNWITTDHLKERVANQSLTPDQVDDLAKEFMSDVSSGKEVADEKGWPVDINRPYLTSKILLTALTFAQQRFFDSKFPDKDIVVNAVHPGFVKTGMTRGTGLFETTDSLPALLLACFVPPGGKPRGQFIWEDASIADWNQPKEELISTFERYTKGGLSPDVLKHLNSS